MTIKCSFVCFGLLACLFGFVLFIFLLICFFWFLAKINKWQTNQSCEMTRNHLKNNRNGQEILRSEGLVGNRQVGCEASDPKQNQNKTIFEHAIPGNKYQHCVDQWNIETTFILNPVKGQGQKYLLVANHISNFFILVSDIFQSSGPHFCPY